MKEEKEKTPLQLTIERMGKELAQAVEDAIAAGAEVETIAGGALVDGVYFGTNILKHNPTVLLDVPCEIIREISNKAEIDRKRKEIEELENELKELQK